MELRDVVDAVQYPVLAGLGLEHDRVERHRELGRVTDITVQVGEELATIGHVACGMALEVPTIKLVLIRAGTEEDSSTRFVNVKIGHGWRGVEG